MLKPRRRRFACAIFSLLPSAFCLQPFAFSLLPLAFCLLPSPFTSHLPLATQSQLQYFRPDVKDTPAPTLAPDDCAEPFLCPLSHVSAGVDVRIKQISASPEVTHRLRELGFCEEQKIKFPRRHGAILCRVCHARLGISAHLAEKILVEPLPSKKVA